MMGTQIFSDHGSDKTKQNTTSKKNLIKPDCWPIHNFGQSWIFHKCLELRIHENTSKPSVLCAINADKRREKVFSVWDDLW